MHGPRISDAVAIVASLMCLGAGFALSGFCDGGYTVILLGAAVAFVGITLTRVDSLAPFLLVALVALILVVAGLYGATAAGCYL